VIPGSIAIGVLLIALVPGWVYLRLRERLRPAAENTALSELLEVLAVGLATTGVAATILTIVPSSWVPFLLDVSRWAIGGNHYVRDHVRQAVVSAFVLLTLAVGIAWVIYWLQRRRQPAEFEPVGNVWVHAIGQRPRGTVPWVGLQLDDGMLVEGLIHSLAMADGAGINRDIALQAPIRVTNAPGAAPTDLPLHRVIIASDRITRITVIHSPERETPTQTRRWARRKAR
jgi:hypothetical protein